VPLARAQTIENLVFTETSTQLTETLNGVVLGNWGLYYPATSYHWLDIGSIGVVTGYPAENLIFLDPVNPGNYDVLSGGDEFIGDLTAAQVAAKYGTKDDPSSLSLAAATIPYSLLNNDQIFTANGPGPDVNITVAGTPVAPDGAPTAGLLVMAGLALSAARKEISGTGLPRTSL
jgi:hypothetical protein